MWDWDLVRVLSLNKRGHAEDAPSTASSPPQMDRHGCCVDGDCGSGFAGRHPGPRRRRAYVERPSRRERDYYRNGV